MAKIAVELEQALKRKAEAGQPGHLATRVLTQGPGWRVADVLCTAGPQDRAFEEQHSDTCIVMVVAGSFQYKSAGGCELMTPGSLLFGNSGQNFECGHEHGAGDRCLAFFYAPEHFESLIADAGTKTPSSGFRLGPVRKLAPLIGRACTALSGASDDAWEELSLELASQMLQLMGEPKSGSEKFPPSSLARVTRVVRRIEQDANAELTLERLAQEAGLSPFHFVRVFRHLTGVTPHQYVLRTRLREAAMRVAAEPERILDIALDCGFGDVSNFNHAFRAEFGVSPREFRKNPVIARDRVIS